MASTCRCRSSVAAAPQLRPNRPAAAPLLPSTVAEPGTGRRAGVLDPVTSLPIFTTA
jgi:hypothetical protein